MTLKTIKTNKTNLANNTNKQININFYLLFVETILAVCVFISLSACGSGSTNTDNSNNSNMQNIDRTSSIATKNNKMDNDNYANLNEEYKSCTGYSLRFPKDFTTDSLITGEISYNDTRGRSLSSQFIFACTYSGGEDVITTSLDNCVGSCDGTIKHTLQLVDNVRYSKSDIKITEQKKVTVNGQEMLKVYGSVKQTDGSETGIIGYYTIINFKMNGTSEGKQQAYWYGFYENTTDELEMENYVDAMAETFKESKSF